MSKLQTIILIGGHFHRHKFEITPDQSIIRIAKNPTLLAQYLEKYIEPVEINYETYRKINSIFGEYGIFPENCFLHTEIDPVEFLKNLVKDYIR